MNPGLSMVLKKQWIVFFLVLILHQLTQAVELTFELADNARECFFEDIQKNTSVVLEFQVVTGGKYDVDVSIEAPTKEVIYRQVKSQFDSHQFVTLMSGTYIVCFSNEFSTYSHKVVYMDFQVGDEPQLPGIQDHVTVMTQMESSTQEVHKSLNSIIDYQTHHRLREAQGRKRAEDLNERVMWWSSIEFVVVLLASTLQVYIVKNFFASRTNDRSYAPLR
uniref:Transmembrane emp24 domain-containing protein 7 n=1 Tax=Cacopsylla melanoneura TaxID=428564 RepID=A0A8D8QSH7_9HEMI